MIRIYCSKADATLQETETLTAGMVNTPVVQFTFSSDWDGLGKSAIVRAGTVIKEVVVSNNQIVVPSECLAKAGVNLIIGVWGGNFTTELPTVWCACGEIQDATNPNSALNHEDATASNVAQMLAAAERAEAALDEIENADWQAVADKVGQEKVNKPLTDPNGTEGQILKTNGDGSTLWVDPPDIFDEEIDTAIGNWLDEHPEATTTVLDNSLSIKKMQTGTLGYVTPETYGAVGDGVADDTAAFQACLNSGERIFIPKKQYNITGVILGNDCEVVEDLGIYIGSKPLYKRKFDIDFTKFYKSGSFPMPADAYDEGITYDSAIKKFIVAYNHHTVPNTILAVINPDSFVVEATYEYPLSTANGLSYNPYTNEILLAVYGSNSGTHRINGTTFEYIGLLQLPNNLPTIPTLYVTFYDPITKTYAVIPHTGDSYPILEIPIRIYDDEFNLLKTISYKIDEAYVGQYYEYYDGKVYRANWDNFLEIDVFTGKYRRLDTAGYFEIEGSCHDDEGVMHIVAHDSRGGIVTQIYSFSDSHIKSWNLKDRYSKDEVYINHDLNTILVDGEYYIEITDSENIDNYHLPKDTTKGKLIVSTVANHGLELDGCSQIFISALNTDRGIYSRIYSSAARSWSPWYGLLAIEVAGTITKHTSITTGTLDSQILRRVGNLVNIGGRIYNMSDQIANANFFMISENCRPNAIRKLLCMYIKEDDTQGLYYVNVNPNGTVQLGLSNSIKIKQIMVAGTYPI